MKKSKKYISILISFIMFINIILCSMPVVSAKKYDGFIYKVKNNKVIITGYEGKEIDLVIPSEIGGKKVVELGNYALNGNQFRSIEIPSTVKIIDSWLYNDYNDSDIKLKKLILHEGLEYVGEWAFNNCEKLKNVKIPKSVKYIEEAAFGIDDGDEWGYWWFIDRFILDCYKGTEGERYAKWMNLDYRLIDKNPDVINQSLTYSKIYNKQNKCNTILDHDYYAPSVYYFKKVYNYTGKQIKPVSHIKLESPVTGKYYNVDKNNYEIEYRNNTDVGFGKAIIRGKNNCYGKTVIEFRIGPPKTKVKSVKNLGSGYVKVKWNKTDRTTGYNIKYSTNNGKSYKTTKIIKNFYTTSHTIKLNINETYLIKVTPYYRVEKSKYPDKVFLDGYKKKRFNTINSGCKNEKKIRI